MKIIPILGKYHTSTGFPINSFFLNMKIFIETERLILRELLDSDVKGIFELDADPEVHEYLGKNPITTIEQASEVISFIRKQYVDNGIGRLAIIEKETNSFVGWGGFKLVTELTNGHQHYYDLGYRLVKRFWGKGYATEAAKGSIAYAFNELKLSTIYAIADANNMPSRHVLEKCHFEYVETFDYFSAPHCWYKLNKADI